MLRTVRQLAARGRVEPKDQPAAWQGRVFVRHVMTGVLLTYLLLPFSVRPFSEGVRTVRTLA